MCDRKGCDTPGDMVPRLKLWSPNRRGQPALMFLRLKICGFHTLNTGVWEFINEEMWKGIEGVFSRSGKVVPDRNLVEVEFLPMTHPSADAFLKACEERNSKNSKGGTDAP